MPTVPWLRRVPNPPGPLAASPCLPTSQRLELLILLELLQQKALNHANHKESHVPHPHRR